MSINNSMLNNGHVKSSDNQTPSTLMRLMIGSTIFYDAPLAIQGTFDLINL